MLFRVRCWKLSVMQLCVSQAEGAVISGPPVVAWAPHHERFGHVCVCMA